MSNRYSVRVHLLVTQQTIRMSVMVIKDYDQHVISFSHYSELFVENWKFLTYCV